MSNDLDTLNDLIEAAEDRLAGLKLGVSANVPLEPGAVLLFTKKSGVWGLYVDGKPLVNTSVHVRQLAVSRLGDMVDALTAAATERRRSGMGRRAGTGGVLVQTRINHDTARWLEKQAAAQGVSVAQWVRSLIVDKKRAGAPPKPTDPLIRIADALDLIAVKLP